MHKRKQMPKQREQCEKLSKGINIVQDQLIQAKAHCKNVTGKNEKILCNEYIGSRETILKNFKNQSKQLKCLEKKS